MTQGCIYGAAHCVIWDELIHLPGLQFPDSVNGDNNSSYFTGLLGEVNLLKQAVEQRDQEGLAVLILITTLQIDTSHLRKGV